MKLGLTSFRAGDVVADNASREAWPTGSVVVKPEDIDLENEKVEVYVDGKLEHTGTGADMQGYPARRWRRPPTTWPAGG